MTKLAERLISTPPREVAGSDSALRFHYQAVYGLTLIFDAHSGDADYALLFEFHDDLALLDDSISPSSVSFFQVKTKEKGAWTLADIIKQKSTNNVDGKKIKQPSHLGKIYYNAINFDEFVKSITFVSNAQMNFGMKSSSFKLEECDNDEINKIIEQIKREHPGITAVNTKILRFVASNLSLSDLDTHAKGKLNDFVVEQLGEVEFSLQGLYRAIVSECARKSRDKQIDSTLVEVVSRRGVTRKDADAWLKKVKERVSVPKWDSFAAELKFPVLQKNKMRQQWSRYCAEVMDANAAVCVVRGEIAKVLSDDFCENLQTLQEVVEYILPKVQNIAQSRLDLTSPERLKVMIIYEAFARSET